MVYFSRSPNYYNLKDPSKVRRLSSSDRLYYEGVIKIIFNKLEQKFKNFKKDDEITRKAYLFFDYQKAVEHAIGNSHSKKHEIRQVFDEEYEMFIKKNIHLTQDHDGILIKC